MSPEPHVCVPGPDQAEDAIYGQAITKIEKWAYEAHPPQWWAHNGEYGTAITYCPFCGLKLP